MVKCIMYYCKRCKYGPFFYAQVDAYAGPCGDELYHEWIPDEFVTNNENSKKQPLNIREAIRNPSNFRYDLLIPEFLHIMAKIGHMGGEKYGDTNYQISRLEGAKSPINHIYDHLRQYRENEKHDYFDNVGAHLAAIAFNAMMEYYWWEKTKKEEEPNGKNAL